MTTLTGTRYRSVQVRAIALGAIAVAWMLLLAVGGTARAAVTADLDGNGRSNVSIYRPANGNFYWLADGGPNSGSNLAGLNLGGPNNIPLPADMDGNGMTNVAIFTPANGNFYWRTDGGLNTTSNLAGLNLGSPGDEPFTADLDGNGRANVGVYRPANGNFYWLADGGLNTTSNLAGLNLGSPGDEPFVANMDTNGVANVGVYRPANGNFYWLSDGRPGAGSNLAGVYLGSPGDKPFVADMDGNGVANVGVYRPANGNFYWRTDAGLNTTSNLAGLNLGSPGDEPFVTDMDGNGTANVGVYRPANGKFYWLSDGRPGGASNLAGLYLGSPGDVPLLRLGMVTPPDRDPPTVSLSGGLWNAKDSALTDGALTVNASDSSSGVASGTFSETTGGTTRQVDSFSRTCSGMCYPKSKAWLTSIDPDVLGWATSGAHSFSVTINDNAGNTTTTSWSVNYYKTSWAYGGPNHIVDTDPEITALAVAEDASNDATRAALWAGLAPSERSGLSGLDPAIRYSDVDMGALPSMYADPSGYPVASAASAGATPAVAPNNWCAGHIIGIAEGLSDRHKYYVGTTNQTVGIYRVGLGATTYDCDNGHSRSYFRLWWDASAIHVSPVWQLQLVRRSGQHKPYVGALTDAGGFGTLQAGTQFQCCRNFNTDPFEEMYPMPDGSAGKMDEIYLAIGFLDTSAFSIGHVIHVPMTYLPIFQP